MRAVVASRGCALVLSLCSLELNGVEYSLDGLTPKRIRTSDFAQMVANQMVSPGEEPLILQGPIGDRGDASILLIKNRRGELFHAAGNVGGDVFELIPVDPEKYRGVVSVVKPRDYDDETVSRIGLRHRHAPGRGRGAPRHDAGTAGGARPGSRGRADGDWKMQRKGSAPAGDAGGSKSGRAGDAGAGRSNPGGSGRSQRGPSNGRSRPHRAPLRPVALRDHALVSKFRPQHSDAPCDELTVIRLAIVLDSAFMAKLGNSVDDAELTVYDILAQVDTMYRRELCATVRLSYLEMQTDPGADPYVHGPLDTTHICNDTGPCLPEPVPSRKRLPGVERSVCPEVVQRSQFQSPDG